MTDERLTVEEWAETLKRKAGRTGLAEQELMAWLLINCNDRLVEITHRLDDLALRYQLLDAWLSDTAPGYRAAHHLERLTTSRQ